MKYYKPRLVLWFVRFGIYVKKCSYACGLWTYNVDPSHALGGVIIFSFYRECIVRHKGLSGINAIIKFNKAGLGKESADKTRSAMKAISAKEARARRYSS